MDTLNSPQRRLRLSPTQTVIGSFFLLILTGSLLLVSPLALNAPAGAVNYIEALFTATSSVCVTGLTVVEICSHYNRFGQLIIMLLIQAGGLGLMTLSSIVYMILRRRIGLRSRILLAEQLNQEGLQGMVRLVRFVVAVTLGTELAGAFLLSFRFVPEFGWTEGIWFSLFHSVSAFCNAGFDLLGSNSLAAYVNDPLVSLVIAALFTIGGIGFPVISELAQRRPWKRLTLHTKLVLVTTALLMIVGSLGFFALEYNNPDTLMQLPWPGKILASLFQSLTPRTAGFATVSYGLMRPATLLLTIVLMFIGASPASTGGGIKTTTFAIVALYLYGNDEAVVFGRRIARDLIQRSLLILMLALVLVVGVTGALLVTETAPFEHILFEAMSAFSTAGLSAGITTSLSPVARLLIIGLMFAGRVGPLSLAIAAGRKEKGIFAYAEGRVIVG